MYSRLYVTIYILNTHYDNNMNWKKIMKIAMVVFKKVKKNKR